MMVVAIPICGIGPVPGGSGITFLLPVARVYIYPLRQSVAGVVSCDLFFSLFEFSWHMVWLDKSKRVVTCTVQYLFNASIF